MVSPHFGEPCRSHVGLSALVGGYLKYYLSELGTFLKYRIDSQTSFHGYFGHSLKIFRSGPGGGLSCIQAFFDSYTCPARALPRTVTTNGSSEISTPQGTHALKQKPRQDNTAIGFLLPILEVSTRIEIALSNSCWSRWSTCFVDFQCLLKTCLFRALVRAAFTMPTKIWAKFDPLWGKEKASIPCISDMFLEN